MGNILIDLNNDREVSELLSVVLYDESHYLRSYLQSMNKELVTIAVEHYARKVPLEKLVRERESALKGVALRKRVVELDREMVAELKRLKTELKRVLQKLQDEKSIIKILV